MLQCMYQQYNQNLIIKTIKREKSRKVFTFEVENKGEKCMYLKIQSMYLEVYLESFLRMCTSTAIAKCTKPVVIYPKINGFLEKSEGKNVQCVVAKEYRSL